MAAGKPRGQSTTVSGEGLFVAINIDAESDIDSNDNNNNHSKWDTLHEIMPQTDELEKCKREKLENCKQLQILQKLHNCDTRKPPNCITRPLENRTGTGNGNIT